MVIDADKNLISWHLISESTKDRYCYEYCFFN